LIEFNEVNINEIQLRTNETEFSASKVSILLILALLRAKLSWSSNYSNWA